MNTSNYRRNRLAFAAFVSIFSASVSVSKAQSAANPGVVDEENLSKYKQVCAISDVHGMYDSMRTLLTAAGIVDANGKWAAGNTLLVVVGDSIDKGPASVKVIDLWRKLQPLAQAKGGRLIVLLGNHEAEFLSKPTSKKSEAFRDELTALNIDPKALARGEDPEGRGNFLLRLPIAAMVGKYLFSHAAWFPTGTTWNDFAARSKSLLQSGKYGDDFITGPHSILEEKDETADDGTDVRWYDNPPSVKNLEKRVSDLGLYGTVFGHQPHAFGFKKRVGAVDELRIIKIDSGMAPESSGGDESSGEMLRFPHPAELLRLTAPTAERIGTDGKAKRLE